MIIKTVTQIGSPIIRKKSKPVKDIKAKKIKAIVQNLIDSMRHYNLVGMAAPQIGHNLRIFVTEIRKTKLRKNQGPKDIDKLRIYINPKILRYSKQKVLGYEGCGSVAFAQLFGSVKRAKKVIIQAQDEHGNNFKLKANRLLARVIQHEYDHIEGVVFIDKIFDMRRLMSRDEYLKKFQK